MFNGWISYDFFMEENPENFVRIWARNATSWRAKIHISADKWARKKIAERKLCKALWKISIAGALNENKSKSGVENVDDV